MANVKYGAGVIQMSGSIAGDVHARNRYGNYIRPRTKPVNPATERQEAARTVIQMLAEAWRESPMTAAKRQAWKTFADSVNWVNCLGEQITLSGFNMFIRCNAAYVAAGGSWVDDGPTDLGLPPGDPSFAVTISAAAQKLSITFDTNFDWVDEDDAYFSAYMGLPQSASRTFFGGPWRYAGSIAGDSVTPPTSPDANIDCPFVAIEGQQVWCQARIIRADARCSTLFTAAPLIVAA